MTAAQDAQDAEDLALRCCVCGTSAEDDSNYLNTKMKMLISKCGHRLCVHRSRLCTQTHMCVSIRRLIDRLMRLLLLLVCVSATVICGHW